MKDIHFLKRVLSHSVVGVAILVATMPRASLAESQNTLQKRVTPQLDNKSISSTTKLNRPLKEAPPALTYREQIGQANSARSAREIKEAVSSLRGNEVEDLPDLSGRLGIGDGSTDRRRHTAGQDADDFWHKITGAPNPWAGTDRENAQAPSSGFPTQDSLVRQDSSGNGGRRTFDLIPRVERGRFIWVTEKRVSADGLSITRTTSSEDSLGYSYLESDELSADGTETTRTEVSRSEDGRTVPVRTTTTYQQAGQPPTRKTVYYNPDGTVNRVAVHGSPSDGQKKGGGEPKIGKMPLDDGPGSSEIPASIIVPPSGEAKRTVRNPNQVDPEREVSSHSSGPLLGIDNHILVTNPPSDELTVRGEPRRIDKDAGKIVNPPRTP